MAYSVIHVGEMKVGQGQIAGLPRGGRGGAHHSARRKRTSATCLSRIDKRFASGSFKMMTPLRLELY